MKIIRRNVRLTRIVIKYHDYFISPNQKFLYLFFQSKRGLWPVGWFYCLLGFVKLLTLSMVLYRLVIRDWQDQVSGIETKTKSFQKT